MKANRQMTRNEFNFTTALKVAYNELYKVQDQIDLAKDAAPQGLSRGQLSIVESRIYDLKAAILHAMKTVGN